LIGNVNAIPTSVSVSLSFFIVMLFLSVRLIGWQIEYPLPQKVS
jgi:hypothetical protein